MILLLRNINISRALKTTSARRYDHMHKLLPKLKPQSEDCLYMNLYVPEKIRMFLVEIIKLRKS